MVNVQDPAFVLPQDYAEFCNDLVAKLKDSSGKNLMLGTVNSCLAVMITDMGEILPIGMKIQEQLDISAEEGVCCDSERDVIMAAFQYCMLVPDPGGRAMVWPKIPYAPKET